MRFKHRLAGSVKHRLILVNIFMRERMALPLIMKTEKDLIRKI